MIENLEVMSLGSFQAREPARSECVEMICLDGKVQIKVRHVKVNRALEFMARNYHQPFKLAKLMEISQMSRRAFMEAFQRHTGIRPGRLLRQMRIEHSKRLLIENDFRLREIAAMSGYKRLDSFCIAFKRVVGMAPKQFQRQEWLKFYKTYPKSQRNGNQATVRQ